MHLVTWASAEKSGLMHPTAYQRVSLCKRTNSMAENAINIEFEECRLGLTPEVMGVTERPMLVCG